MANNADALYSAIFDTLAQLKNKEAPMDIDRAKAVAGVVQTAINLAKVEVEYLKVQGGSEVRFLDEKARRDATAQLPTANTITHRLK
ncbi:hypothetical protein [Candidatus Nitrotoga sp. M5]|uniref:hypothetical protein n=1 Tax=Candidatus Nitrotoga sp. M5 TaxID=2890409 RepID=UPI001EF6CAB4|nr:hypothetical protein [Candidatus Nitrotoga sp. M5]CAH1387062.1 conserved hypothetical protein [Candidatus Nitrotoga sp. M5]